MTRSDLLKTAAVALCCALARPSHGGVALVGEGQPPCPILRPAEPDPLEETAATRLAEYLERICGVEFPVQAAEARLPERAIIVGPLGGSLPEGLPDEGFAIKTDGDRLHIVGGSPRGTLYGVFAYLQDVLGCRWWTHTEEDIPERAAIELGDLNIVRKPPFTIHNLMNREAQSRTNDFRYKSRATSREGFTGGHTLYPLLTPYAEEHPEIYPLNKDGERKANKLHFCYLADGIADALADALEKQVQKRNGDVKHAIYFAGMGDWYGGMCQCPACKQVYEDETWTDPDGRTKPGYTATLLTMINRTAEILERKHPGIRVGTFAYMSLEAPPARTVPRHNVVIRIPRLRHCTMHAADECEKNQSFRRNLERWLEIAPRRTYIWDYGADFRNFIFPFPCLRSIAGNIALYHRLGVRGVMVQGNYVTTGSDLVALKNYVWSRLLWDPTLDPDELIREFCAGYYGPAAEEMLEYVNALEDSVRVPEMIHANEFALPNDYLPERARKRLRQLRDRALAGTGGTEPYLRRVHEATVGIEALTMARPGALVERGGRLVRKDFGEYTYPRARELLRYVRNSGPTEWNTGTGYWMGFLAAHGGPLVTLSRGPIEVKVAPAAGGQLRQITYRGKQLLHVPRDPKEKRYPRTGGSSIALGKPAMRVAGEPSPTRVELEDAIEIPDWRYSSQRSVLQTVEIDEGLGIVVTATMEPKAKPKAASVSTVYAAGKDITGVQLQYLTREGQWESAEIPADADGLALANAAELRLTFLKKGCVVLDRYISPGVTEIQVTFDPGKGALTTVVKTQPVGREKGKENVPLTRILQVTGS
ncbi:MAG: DUF4838 domain-containing protein [Armatimonadota bacterium]